MKMLLVSKFLIGIIKLKQKFNSTTKTPIIAEKFLKYQQGQKIELIITYENIFIIFLQNYTSR